MGKARKFGAFSGVFTPSILSILGVIMYLRLPWIVGVGGLWTTLGIIMVAHLIAIATGLSVSSIATNKKVETGGSYYIISRSLGLPIGGTLGVALFVGLSFSVSLYLIGFAETLISFFGFDPSLENIRWVGSFTLIAVTAITFISTSLAIKSQYLIMAAIGLSLLSVFLGSHAYSPGQPILTPVAGSLPWITLFAIFFPAVTGFQAGVSMSGDLRDPRKSIPLGTISAILFGMLVYVGLAVFFSYTVEREMLINDPRVLFQISWVPHLVIAGILGATLSSGMVSILGAPRILQAVAMDRILPAFFSKGHGSSNEPRNALLLAFVIALAGILIGELNVIARLVSIFFIITYGFLNITYALESWAGSDFRPSFKIPRVVSIVGALACIVVMIRLDIVALIVASVLLSGLFLFLKRRELTLQTGDTWTGVWSSLVKTGLGKLSAGSNQVRNWRPNIILFSGGETSRPHLVEMGKSIVGKMGVFTNFVLSEQPSGEVLFGFKEDSMARPETARSGIFTRHHSCRDIYEGMDMISRVYGFPGFEPNTILMGWARNSRQPEKFIRLLSNLKKQNFNALMLSYNKEKGFGNFKSIDVWWKGEGRNLSLAMVLLRFITSGEPWIGAKIRIIVINQDSGRTDSLYALVHQLLDNYRLMAEVKVINNGVEQLPEEDIMAAESGKTDLVMLEIPNPDAKEVQAIMNKAKGMTDVLGTSLLISASSFFDEASVASSQGTGELVRESSGGPNPDILTQHISLSREIISNEVNNTSATIGRMTQKYFEDGLRSMKEADKNLFPELDQLSMRILDGLEKATKEEKAVNRSKEYLRLLNDFSFHSQRIIATYREKYLENRKKVLGGANYVYLDNLRAMIHVMPESIHIKLNKTQWGVVSGDSWVTRLYKTRKRLVSAVLNKPVTHKIKPVVAARYFLYHRRLNFLQKAMQEFSLHSFTEVVELRKILTSIHELIEKSRLESRSSGRAHERVLMEKSRIRARIKLIESQSEDFYNATGQALYEDLRADLVQYGQHLERPASSRAGQLFSAQCRKDGETVETISEFAGVWHRNLSGFLNKATLDFYVLSLKGRIQSKVRKHHDDFRHAMQSELSSRLDAYMDFARQLMDNVSPTLPRLEHASLQVVSVSSFFQGLYTEIRDLLHDIPEKVEISSEQLGERIQETAMEESDQVVVSLRKTIEYYLGSELIDHSLRITREAEVQIREVVASVKDMIRLLNFSLENEAKEDVPEEQKHRREQLDVLVKNFRDKMSTAQNRIGRIVGDVETGFETGLKNGFDPLSSATISKRSNELRKKSREGDPTAISGRLQRNWQWIRRAPASVLLICCIERVPESFGLVRLSSLEKRKVFPTAKCWSLWSGLPQTL